MKPSSEFDIIVYGATGFTGQLVAEYLAQHYVGKTDPKWAMAGRNLEKLASVRDAIGAPADTTLIKADASDPASLKAMVDQTRSVLTTVGPYQLYGTELVAACTASGTAASARATFEAVAKDLSLVALLKDPFVLTPGFEGPKQPPGNRPMLEEDLQSWAAPFVMATINTRNIHRSNMLMGFPYGKEFIYDEMVLTGPGEKGEANARRVMAANTEKSGPNSPRPGEGPSKEERENGRYDLLYVAIAPDGRQGRASVKGDRDPGYGSTSKMIGECAICLLRDAPEVLGGIWTPVAAMGNRLIKRLVDHAGLTVEVEWWSPASFLITTSSYNR